jgi:hypothetical protein
MGGTFLHGRYVSKRRGHVLPLAVPGFLAAQSKPASLGEAQHWFFQWKLLNADAFKLRYTVDGENAPMPVRLYGKLDRGARVSVKAERTRKLRGVGVTA